MKPATSPAFISKDCRLFNFFPKIESARFDLASMASDCFFYFSASWFYLFSNSGTILFWIYLPNIVLLLSFLKFLIFYSVALVFILGFSYSVGWGVHRDDLASVVCWWAIYTGIGPSVISSIIVLFCDSILLCGNFLTRKGTSLLISMLSDYSFSCSFSMLLVRLIPE